MATEEGGCGPTAGREGGRLVAKRACRGGAKCPIGVGRSGFFAEGSVLGIAGMDSLVDHGLRGNVSRVGQGLQIGTGWQFEGQSGCQVVERGWGVVFYPRRIVTYSRIAFGRLHGALAEACLRLDQSRLIKVGKSYSRLFRRERGRRMTKLVQYDLSRVKWS